MDMRTLQDLYELLQNFKRLSYDIGVHYFQIHTNADEEGLYSEEYDAVHEDIVALISDLRASVNGCINLYNLLVSKNKLQINTLNSEYFLSNLYIKAYDDADNLMELVDEYDTCSKCKEHSEPVKNPLND
jgi:hypothetical protein